MLAQVAPFPPCFVWVVCFLLGLLGALLPGPTPASPGTRAYSPLGHLRFPFRSALPAAPHLHRLLLPNLLLPARSVLCSLRRCIVVFFFVVCPPSLSRCVSCLVVSCPCCVFFLPSSLQPRTSALHAGHRVEAPLGVHLRSLRPRRACPLAVTGQARWAPLPRVTLLSSLSSLPSPPPPATCPLSALLLLLSCSVCSLLLFPSPGLYPARSHAPLRLRPVLLPVGRLGQPPKGPLRGDSPVIRSCRPPLHQFRDGGAGRALRFNAGHRHGVSLRGTWCTFVPFLAPCVPILPARPCPSGAPAFFPWLPLLSRSSLPTRALRVLPAQPCVTPASPPCALSPCLAISTLLTTYPPSLRWASLASSCLYISIRCDCLRCSFTRVFHLWVSPMPYSVVPTLSPGIGCNPHPVYSGVFPSQSFVLPPQSPTLTPTGMP